jgi:hypothetical protein
MDGASPVPSTVTRQVRASLDLGAMEDATMDNAKQAIPRQDFMRVQRKAYYKWCSNV